MRKIWKVISRFVFGDYNFILMILLWLLLFLMIYNFFQMLYYCYFFDEGFKVDLMLNVDFYILQVVRLVDQEVLSLIEVKIILW